LEETLIPTYAYRCQDCRQEFDVVKRVADIDQLEECPECCAFVNSASRLIVPVNFNGAADWNTQTFNPALGCYTRNTLHARQIAKSRGLEEVGTEPVEKIHKHFEKQQEETRAARWDDAMKVKVYD
jgi:putative FmdB family regulatory protein